MKRFTLFRHFCRHLLSFLCSPRNPVEQATVRHWRKPVIPFGTAGRDFHIDQIGLVKKVNVAVRLFRMLRDLSVSSNANLKAR